MIRRPPRSTLSSSSAASDVYKRQILGRGAGLAPLLADEQVQLDRPGQLPGRTRCLARRSLARRSLARRSLARRSLARRNLARRAVARGVTFAGCVQVLGPVLQVA